ncbi:MAG: hypothetical protein ABEJ65_10260 [bacterium]
MPEIDVEDLSSKLASALAGNLSKIVTVSPLEDHSKCYDIEIRENKFFGVFRSSSKVSQVSRAIEEGRQVIKEKDKNSSLLVIVPYMGEVGRERCQKENVSWLDLSGNASINEDNLTIHIEGKENKYKRPGRPSNLFAPKSSRVARFLFIHHGESFKQSKIAEGTDLGKGYVSKIINGMEEEDLVVKDSGGVRVRDPDLLLDAWREEYNFTSHEIIKGTVPAKSGKDAMKQVVTLFEKQNYEYAATGLVAGWCYTKFADFRTASFYVPFPVTDTVEAELGFQEGAKGANLWLVSPKDNWVMDGSKEVEGVECVHPVQGYLDLVSGHPERSKEVAEELRKEFLTWDNG